MNHHNLDTIIKPFVIPFNEKDNTSRKDINDIYFLIQCVRDLGHSDNLMQIN